MARLRAICRRTAARSSCRLQGFSNQEFVTLSRNCCARRETTPPVKKMMRSANSGAIRLSSVWRSNPDVPGIKRSHTIASNCSPAHSRSSAMCPEVTTVTSCSLDNSRCSAPANTSSSSTISSRPRPAISVGSPRVRFARSAASIIGGHEVVPTTWRMQPRSLGDRDIDHNRRQHALGVTRVELDQEAARPAIDVHPMQIADRRLHVDRHGTPQAKW